MMAGIPSPSFNTLPWPNFADNAVRLYLLRIILMTALKANCPRQRTAFRSISESISLARYPEQSVVSCCAAGARPTINNEASGSPNPGTGLPQYCQSRNSFLLFRATSSLYSTKREQRRQLTTWVRTLSSRLAEDSLGPATFFWLLEFPSFKILVNS